MPNMNKIISDITTRLTNQAKKHTTSQSPAHPQNKIGSVVLATAITSMMATSPLATAATDDSQFKRLPHALKLNQTSDLSQNSPTTDNTLNTPNNSMPINADSTNTKMATTDTIIINPTSTVAIVDNNDIETDNSLNKQFTEESNTDAGEAVSGYNTDSQSIDSITKNTQRATPYNENINLTQYAKEVNRIQWYDGMKQNNAMSAKLQALLDWNHASPGPIDGGWGMNSIKALKNFQAMKGLKQTGRMDTTTWQALNKSISTSEPVLKGYTITKEDTNTNFVTTPSGSQAKSKMKGLYYQDIYEMLAERFHMDVRYLKKLNPNKRFVAGETITVYNPGKTLNRTITRVVANKADKTLYAYDGDTLIATYPTTVGSTATPSPHGTFKIVNKVKMPWYKSTVGEGENKQVYMLPPGPNSPVGVVWMGLNKPSYGIHGSPIPEGISRQASHGCIRLTNWDVLEVFANIKNGAKVELQ